MKIFLIDSSLFTLPYDSHLASGLAENNNQVFLIGRNLRLGETLENTSFKFIPLFYHFSEGIKNNKFIFKLVRNILKTFEHIICNCILIKFICSERPDVVHYQWMAIPIFDSLVIRYLKYLGFNLVFTVHDTRPFNGSPTSFWQNFCWRSSLNLFNQLIVHTNFSGCNLENFGISKNKINVVSHGILYFGSFSSPIKYKNSEKEILFWGAIKPYKGLDVLLNAFSMLQDKNVKLKIIGKVSGNGSSYRILSEKLKISQRVDFDFRFFADSELPNILSRAYLVVFPYLQIDGSGAVLTTIAYKKPIIASEIGMFKELFSNFPEALFPSNNPELLAAKIDLALADEAYFNTLQEAASSVSENIPTWKKIGETTSKIYKKYYEF